MWPFKKRKKKLLIIEDETDLADIISQVIEDLPCEIKICSSVFEAGTMLLKTRPDVVLLDLKMPKLFTKKKDTQSSGLIVLELIRENDLPTKVIVVSGSTQNKIDEAIQMGAHDYLNKPFKPEDLREKVQKFL